MKRYMLVAALAVLGSAPALAGDVQLSATKYAVNATDGRAQFIEITNRGDAPIEIRSVEVNRGNCKSWSRPAITSKPVKLPMTIGFGQKYAHVTTFDCNIIEISVLTNRGGYALSW